jgi:hypothetical protein
MRMGDTLRLGNVGIFDDYPNRCRTRVVAKNNEIAEPKWALKLVCPYLKVWRYFETPPSAREWR